MPFDRRIVSIPMLLACASLGPGTASASADTVFSIPRRDTPVVEPLVASIAVADEPDLGPRRLVLLDHAGTVLGETGPLEAGEIDLRRRIPEIDRLERAAWLQAMVGDEPVGSSWVVVPMRDRPALRTTTALRPDGETEYTRVVGWGDTPLEPVDDDVRETAETWEPSPRPIMGFRCHREMDVVLETEFGDLVVALRPDEAPNTARNFRELAAAGFYDGTIVHRVVPLDREGRPFVIQGGDPTGAGEGGPGYTIPFERTGLGHDFGVISMARDDDPDSAGSQWFIGLSRAGTARLDGQYAAFGEVVEGAAVIVEIAGVRLADVVRGRPEAPPVVRRASLRPAPPRRPGHGRPDARVEPVSVLPPTPPAERRTDPGR